MPPRIRKTVSETDLIPAIRAAGEGGCVVRLKPGNKGRRYVVVSVAVKDAAASSAVSASPPTQNPETSIANSGAPPTMNPSGGNP